MKYVNLAAILFAITFFSACKKDDTSPTPNGSGKSMGFLTEFAAVPGGGYVKNRYILLDIDHASNSNKKFMTVDIVEAGGGYKFQPVEGPKPISEYATNFPESLRKIVSGHGYGHDFLAGAYMYMRSTTGITRPYTFTYDSIHKIMPLSSVIIPINEMHNVIYAGSMVGKEPRARIEFLAPGKPSPGTTPIDPTDTMPEYFFYGLSYKIAKPAKVYFYFNEGDGMYTSVVSPTSRANYFHEAVFRPISALTGKADAAISYNGSYPVIFFFDFDKWEYMTIKMPCPAVYGSACTATVEVSAVKSMNTLMDWPADWRK